ncbi:hypothetical protein V6N13_073203 [Hibiscus sabdariffa]
MELVQQIREIIQMKFRGRQTFVKLFAYVTIQDTHPPKTKSLEKYVVASSRKISVSEHKASPSTLSIEIREHRHFPKAKE